MKYLSLIVVLEGFEPSHAEPKSDVLPLHHRTIKKLGKPTWAFFYFTAVLPLHHPLILMILVKGPRIELGFAVPIFRSNSISHHSYVLKNRESLRRFQADLNGLDCLTDNLCTKTREVTLMHHHCFYLWGKLDLNQQFSLMQTMFYLKYLLTLLRLTEKDGKSFLVFKLFPHINSFIIIW